MSTFGYAHMDTSAFRGAEDSMSNNKQPLRRSKRLSTNDHMMTMENKANRNALGDITNVAHLKSMDIANSTQKTRASTSNMRPMTRAHHRLIKSEEGLPRDIMMSHNNHNHHNTSEMSLHNDTTMSMIDDDENDEMCDDGTMIIDLEHNTSTSSTSTLGLSSMKAATGWESVNRGSARMDQCDSQLKQQQETKTAAASLISANNNARRKWPLEQEYSNDIHVTLLTNERKYRPRLDYMETVQGDINHTMRGILVDWLVEVAEEYKLSQQTLLLTISYIDRLLSRLPVNRTKLQLVGITAMLIASKYEEIFPPSIDEFVYISDNTYTREEVLRMESVLLNTLTFCLTSVTPFEFTCRSFNETQLCETTRALTSFITEGFLQEAASLSFLPSVISASAISLSCCTINQPPWSEELERTTGYQIVHLRPCILHLHAAHVKLCSDTSTLKAVRDKYSTEKFGYVARISPIDLSEATWLEDL